MTREGLLPRLRLPRPAGRLRDRRAHHPLRAGRHLRTGAPRRPPQHAHGERRGHRPGDPAGPRRGHRAAVAQLAGEPPGRSRYVELFRNTPLLAAALRHLLRGLPADAAGARLASRCSARSSSTSAASTCPDPSSRRTARRGSSSSSSRSALAGVAWLVAGAPRGRRPARRAACAGWRCSCSSACRSWAGCSCPAARSSLELPEARPLQPAGRPAASRPSSWRSSSAWRSTRRPSSPRSIRGGIEAVSTGQREAARAIGLPGGPDAPPGGAAAGAAGHHPAAHQPVPQPHQELQPGPRHRLRGPLQRQPHGLRARPASPSRSSSSSWPSTWSSASSRRSS